nr:helix-turn-helix transcriptional regulator [Frankia sp. Cppng1_Ct_nod]
MQPESHHQIHGQPRDVLPKQSLADRLDVSRQTVNAIETGRFDPSLPLAFKIAAVFEGRIEDLFFPPEDTGPEA